MTSLFVGKAPLFAGDAAEIGRVVDDGVVEGILLLHPTLTETVAVTQLQLDGVTAGLAVLITNLLQRGILCAVENPNRIGTGLRSVVGYHLVGLLIDAELEIHTVYGRNTVGIRTFETVGRTGNQEVRGKN